MERIEQILGPLYQAGTISMPEYIAIFGSVHFMANADPLDQDKFRTEYGTIGAEALSRLVEEVPPK